MVTTFRKKIDAHPLPWFCAALAGAFLTGVGTYQAVISWGGFKVVRDEARMKLGLRVETTPSDATIALGQDASKFFQGMPIPDGPNEISVSRPGYRTQTVRIARTGGTLVVSVSLPNLVRLTSGDSVTYTGEKMTFTFEHMDVRAFFEMMGDLMNQNVILGEGVEGKISLSLKDVPWDQVIDIAARKADLEVRRKGNVILVDVP